MGGAGGARAAGGALGTPAATPSLTMGTPRPPGSPRTAQKEAPGRPEAGARPLEMQPALRPPARLAPAQALSPGVGTMVWSGDSGSESWWPALNSHTAAVITTLCNVLAAEVTSGAPRKRAWSPFLLSGGEGRSAGGLQHLQAPPRPTPPGFPGSPARAGHSRATRPSHSGPRGLRGPQPCPGAPRGLAETASPVSGSGPAPRPLP